MDSEKYVRKAVKWYENQSKKRQSYIKGVLEPFGLAFALAWALTSRPDNKLNKWTIIASTPMALALLPFTIALIISQKEKKIS